MKTKLRLVLFLFFLLFFAAMILFLLGGKKGIYLYPGVLIPTILLLIAYLKSDYFVLKTHNAHLADHQNKDYEMGLHEKVAIECEKLSLPAPKIYFISDQFPLVFVVGKNRYDASLVFSKGVLSILSTEELEAVIIQQLNQIKEGDLFISTLTAAIGCLLFPPALFKEYCYLIEGKKLEKKQQKKTLSSLLGFIGFWFLAPLASLLVRAIIPANKATVADKKSLFLIDRPDALANAINKVHNLSKNTKPLYCSLGASHLYFVNPYWGWKTFGMFANQTSPKTRIQNLYQD